MAPQGLDPPTLIPNAVMHAKAQRAADDTQSVPDSVDAEISASGVDRNGHVKLATNGMPLEGSSTADADSEVGDMLAQKTKVSRVPHKERLNIDRLGVALEKAHAATSTNVKPPTPSKDQTRIPRLINLQFDNSKDYVMPWMACHPWEIMEVLLKEGTSGRALRPYGLTERYREDEAVLNDMSNGDFILVCASSGHIHPQMWEEVVEHNDTMRFIPHSSYLSNADREAGYEDQLQ
ncbi:hypothetical protein CC86DRAFT_384379 [Ophiobolus disseminans]|uniref:Uncharacterized protein n=1 Tax=Ophiobolus disseminans TaxID=1469910 RepID=A0A6A6ZS01_9PLEO|nr:hypothetical protein CC86DRAFT_384379 [Ophiobolus disseminans]